MPILEHDPQIGMVYGDVAFMDGDGHITHPGPALPRPALPLRGDEFRALLEQNYVSSAATLVRREAWRLVLPWTVNLGPGDWWGHLKIARRWPLCYVPRIVADYRVHAESMHVHYQRSIEGEAVINLILDDMFSEPDERLPPPRERLRVRAGHWRELAFGYIAQRRYADARRLLRAALRLHPILLKDGMFVRQLVATHVGYERYVAWKRMLKFGTR